MFDLTLTFDNGPDAETTPVVLDELAARGIAATFFVIGQKLTQPGAAALSARAHAAGHWIGNHSWTHSVPLGEQAGRAVAETEVGQTQAAIAPLAHARRYFRPFGGGGNLDRRLFNREVVDYLQAGQFTCVLWNAVPRDWADPEGWVETALAQCASQPWSLMVLHDLPTGAMRHLPRFLDAVQAQGGRIRQDFPPDCVPMVDGRIARPMDGFIAA